MSASKASAANLAMMGQVGNLEEVIAKYSGIGGGRRSLLTSAFATIIALTASHGKRSEPHPHEWLQAEHLAASIGLTMEEASRLDPLESPDIAKAGTLSEAQFRLCREVQTRLVAAAAINRKHGLFVKAAEVGSTIEQAVRYGVAFDAGRRMPMAAPTGNVRNDDFLGDGDPLRGLGAKFQALWHEEYKPVKPPVRGGKN
ncbi:hypothetical protein D9M68_337810 [compost metagenome]